MKTHPSHKKIVMRLKRARGHLDKVISMIEREEPCTPTAQQLHAVVRALEQSKRIYVEDHINHCIRTDVSPQEAEALLTDLKEIAKYL
ncbi:MAG: metal-sensing transcriptional repressor [Spirochaetales bacterium]|nr:metal-sensing transcriptional repressor [Spirochaetales bacterium]